MEVEVVVFWVSPPTGLAGSLCCFLIRSGIQQTTLSSPIVMIHLPIDAKLVGSMCTHFGVRTRDFKTRSNVIWTALWSHWGFLVKPDSALNLVYKTKHNIPLLSPSRGIEDDGFCVTLGPFYSDQPLPMSHHRSHARFLKNYLQSGEGYFCLPPPSISSSPDTSAWPTADAASCGLRIVVIHNE